MLRIVFSLIVFLLAQANIVAADFAAFLDPNTPMGGFYLNGEKIMVRALLIDEAVDGAKITSALRSPSGEVTETTLDLSAGWRQNTVVEVFNQEVSSEIESGEYNLVVYISAGEKSAKLAHHFLVRQSMKRRFPRFVNFAIAFKDGEVTNIGADGGFLNPASRFGIFTPIRYWVGDLDHPEDGRLAYGYATNYRTTFLQVPTVVIPDNMPARPYKLLVRLPLSELAQRGDVEEAFGTTLIFTSNRFAFPNIPTK